MSDNLYYKDYYQKNKEKILFRIKNNYYNKKFKEPKFRNKKEENKEENKEEEVKPKEKKNIIVSFD